MSIPMNSPLLHCGSRAGITGRPFAAPHDTPSMDQLKLIAFDAEDLDVISAHLQDAILKAGDMSYLPKEKRFVAVLNRFDWSLALESGVKRTALRRRQTALRFERVLKAQYTGIDLAHTDATLSLLALRFEPAGPEDPAGAVVLYFSGSGAVRLEVECIEAEMKDLGPAWRARRRPNHPEDEAGR
jgi:Protein of unknown function (DUF2948)